MDCFHDRDEEEDQKVFHMQERPLTSFIILKKKKPIHNAVSIMSPYQRWGVVGVGEGGVGNILILGWILLASE